MVLKNLFTKKSLIITWLIIYALLLIIMLGQNDNPDFKLSSPGPFIFIIIFSFVIAFIFCMIFGAIHYIKNKEKEFINKSVKSSDVISSAKFSTIAAAILTFSNILYIVLVMLSGGIAYFLSAFLIPMIYATRYPTLWLVKVLGFNPATFYIFDSTSEAFTYPGLTISGYMLTFIIWFVIFFSIARFSKRIKKTQISPTSSQTIV
jgi:hypothetical protein